MTRRMPDEQDKPNAGPEPAAPKAGEESRPSLKKMIERRRAAIESKLSGKGDGEKGEVDATAAPEPPEAPQHADPSSEAVPAAPDTAAADTADAEAPPPDGAPGAAAQPASEETASHPTSLQELIAQQRARLQAGLSHDEEATAAPEPGGERPPDAAGDQVPVAAQAAAPAPSHRLLLPLAALRPKAGTSSRLVHALLIINTVVILLLAAILIWQFGEKPAAHVIVPQTAGAQEIAAAGPAQPVAPDLGEPLSWAQAEADFARGQHAAALDAYRRLAAVARTRPGEALVADFLTLRQGMCLWLLGQADDARQAIGPLVRSRSPIIRAVAWSQLGQLDVADGLYLPARTKGYLALGALGVLEREAVRPLRTDCDFLVARALAVQCLSFYGKEQALDWGHVAWLDPFATLPEQSLRALLAEGSERLTQATLGPQVHELPAGGVRREWVVDASQARIDELLERLASQAGLNVEWVNVVPAARQRVVTMYGRGLAAARVAEVACGAAGLVAHFTGEKIVVYDPQGFEQLSQKRELIVREAGTCLRLFFLGLRGEEDPRLRVGHLALACVLEYSGDPLGALKEYQLTAGLFKGKDVAAEALMRSAALRVSLRNYAGARRDLAELRDLYQNYRGHDRIYLALGEVNMRSGRLPEAIHDFRTLYYANLSSASKAAAAFGMGRCYFLEGNDAEAEKWLNRYIGSAGQDAEHLAEAHLLLGQTYRRGGDPVQAESEFRRMLACRPSRRQRSDALLALAGVYVDTERLVPALGALRELEWSKLEGELLCEALVALGSTYRNMGLPAKAIRLLEGRLPDLGEPALQARVLVEIARCHEAQEDLRTARAVFARALQDLPSGRDRHLANCRMAALCLRLGDVRKAAALAEDTLKATDDADVRRQASKALGDAYMHEHEYAKAVLAYSDMLHAASGVNTP